jgi:hypothetical protein
MRVLMLLALLLPVLSFGSPESDKRRFEETQVLADQGDVDAQFNLGSMYRKNSESPQGVPPFASGSCLLLSISAHR